MKRFVGLCSSGRSSSGFWKIFKVNLGLLSGVLGRSRRNLRTSEDMAGI